MWGPGQKTEVIPQSSNNTSDDGSHACHDRAIL